MKQALPASTCRGARIDQILADLGFASARRDGRSRRRTWRRDVEGKADLVEEVARIDGFAALPSEPLPEMPRAAAAC